MANSQTIEKERIKNSNKIDELRAKGDELRAEYDKAVADEQITNKVAGMSEAEKTAMRVALDQTVATSGIASKKG